MLINLFLVDTHRAFILSYADTKPYIARECLIVKSNIPDYNPDEPSSRYYPCHMDLSTPLPLDWPRKGVKKSFRFIPFFFFFFLSLFLVLCTDYFIRSICLCFRRINKNSRMIPAALFYPVKIENLRILCFLNYRQCLFGIRNYEKWSRVASILLVRLVRFYTCYVVLRSVLDFECIVFEIRQMFSFLKEKKFYGLFAVNFILFFSCIHDDALFNEIYQKGFCHNKLFDPYI